MIIRSFNCSDNVKSFLGFIKGLGNVTAAWSGPKVVKTVLGNHHYRIDLGMGVPGTPNG